jgi:segregation and condensation protein B
MPEGGERAVMSEMVAPEMVGQLEAILFASDAPLPVERIAEVLEIDPLEARALVEALRAACDEAARGLAVAEVGGGVRLVTRPEHAPVLMSLQRLRLKSRLSRAAVETLTIVAYRQPISRPEIEQLRGVGTESVLTHLLERRLVRVVGRKATPGRPVLYGTTREFLEHFGLRDLGDLPPFESPGGAAGEASAGSGTAEAAADATPGPDPVEMELALDAEAGEGGLEETRPDEVRPDEIRPDQVRPDQVREERGLSSPA